MSTWDQVHKGLKKTGMAGDVPLTKNEQSNITPKLSKYIFESSQRVSIEAIEAEMKKLKPSSERYKGMQKALDAVKKIADPSET